MTTKRFNVSFSCSQEKLGAIFGALSSEVDDLKIEEVITPAPQIVEAQPSSEEGDRPKRMPKAGPTKSRPGRAKAPSKSETGRQVRKMMQAMGIDYSGGEAKAKPFHLSDLVEYLDDAKKRGFKINLGPTSVSPYLTGFIREGTVVRVDKGTYQLTAKGMRK